MATSTIVLLSDSINSWFVNTPDLSAFMAEALYDHFGVTVRTAECASVDGAYNAQQLTWLGSGADEIHMYDGSVGGKTWEDFDTAASVTARVTDVSADIVLIHLGVNGGENGADGIGSLVDRIQAASPSSEIIMLSENPITAHGPTDTNRNTIQSVAALESLTFVDVYQAYIDTGDYASYLSDGTHPNDSGNALHVATVAPTLKAAIGLDVQEVSMSILDSADLLLRAYNYSGTGDWLDESGNGYDAVPTGSPTHDGSKFTLNGTSQYFTVADQDELDPGTGDLTVIVVTQIEDSWTGTGRIVSKRAGGVSWWDMYIDGNAERSFNSINDMSATFSVNTIADTMTKGGVRALSMRVIRAGTMRCGIDGSYYNGTSLATLASPTSSSTAMTIGTWGSSYYKGDIYGVAVWNESLSDAEVEAAAAGLSLDKGEAATLHGDALFDWLYQNVSSSFTSLELVGALNELNGTEGVEYAEARGTYLGIDPAG